jgi:hypothetical protein
MHRGSTGKRLISWRNSLWAEYALKGFVRNLLDTILEGFGTKPCLRNLFDFSLYNFRTEPLVRNPFDFFCVKVWYRTFCTKPFFPFTKKKFHTKPSFYETKNKIFPCTRGKILFWFRKMPFFFRVHSGFLGTEPETDTPSYAMMKTF